MLNRPIEFGVDGALARETLDNSKRKNLKEFQDVSMTTYVIRLLTMLNFLDFPSEDLLEDFLCIHSGREFCLNFH